MRPILLIFICLSLSTAWSQNIDSLRSIADTANFQSDKVEAAWSLVVHFDSTQQYQNAFNYAKVALEAAQRLQDRDREADVYLKLAKLSIDIGRRNEALDYLRLYSLIASDKRTREKLKQLEEDYNSLENNYRALQNYVSSLENILTDERSRRLEYEISSSNYRKYMISAVVALGLFSIVFIFILNRSGKRIKSMMGKNSSDYQNTVSERNELSEQVRTLGEKQKASDKRRNQELILSQKIQSEFLDHATVFANAFPNSFVYSKAKELASGDFLWTGQSGDKNLLLLADTGSSGVSATYLIILIRELMVRLAKEGINAPTMILTMLDQQIRSRISITGNENFFGIKGTVISISSNQKEAQVSSSLLPVYHMSGNDLNVVPGGGQSIGGLTEGDKFFETHTLTLKKKDFLYLISDGFEDQLGGAASKRFSRPSIRKLITSISAQKLEEQEFMFEKVFSDWRKTQPQTDDVTVVGLRI